MSPFVSWATLLMILSPTIGYAALSMLFDLSEDSFLYLAYLGVSLITVLGSFFRYIFDKDARFSAASAALILASFVIACSYALDLHPGPEVSKYFLYFIGISFPALLGGILLSWFDISSLVRPAKVAMVILTISVLIYELHSLARGWVNIGLGGISYQTASYVAATAFALNSFLLIREISSLKHTRNRSKVAGFILFGFMQIGCSILSGGRGGLVACIAIALVLCLWYAKESKKGGSRYTGVLIWLSILVAAALIFVILQELQTTDLAGVSRLVRENSDRIQIYQACIEGIIEAPLGHGVFSYMKNTPGGVLWPHNLILEVAYCWGVPVALLLMFGLVIGILRVVNSCSRCADYWIVVMLSVVAFSELMVSATYLSRPMFWFLIAYYFNFDKREHLMHANA